MAFSDLFNLSVVRWILYSSSGLETLENYDHKDND
jgi:hypothetical protein